MENKKHKENVESQSYYNDAINIFSKLTKNNNGTLLEIDGVKEWLWDDDKFYDQLKINNINEENNILKENNSPKKININLNIPIDIVLVIQV